uniref:Ig-like domain-containing protein n=1 Tax=Acanthochromis polyacanthus TaxID=80966 RepID=A0A3Q1FFT3_9TELE
LIWINFNFSLLSSSAQELITAERGQDVILPCKAPKNIIIKAVEWRRPGLDPDHVLFYRDGHLDLDNQHPSYQNRVDLQDKEMKDGDVSLILKNVTMEDTGKYECRVFEEGNKDPISIDLVVLEPGEFVLRVQFVSLMKLKDVADETLEKTDDLTDVQTPDISDTSVYSIPEENFLAQDSLFLNSRDSKEISMRGRTRLNSFSSSHTHIFSLFPPPEQPVDLTADRTSETCNSPASSAAALWSFFKSKSQTKFLD